MEPNRSFSIVPTGSALGADIIGIDVTTLSDEDCVAIRAAWLDHLVLRFRDQKLDEDSLLAFTRRFGRPDAFPKAKFANHPQIPDKPEIGVISNIVDDHGAPIGIFGNNECLWHTDMAYIEEPPSASILYALEVSETGGETGFLNMYAALEALPDDLRRRLEGRRLKHENVTLSDGNVREGMEDQIPDSDDVRDWHGPYHPIIRVHPETQRQALFLGRRVHAYIEELPVEESEEILDQVWDYTTRSEHTWDQEWQVGDLVMWDNRCTMHRRGAFEPNEHRLLHRTQLKGDRPC